MHFVWVDLDLSLVDFCSMLACVCSQSILQFFLGSFFGLVSSMASSPLMFLISGHSFVQRPSSDLSFRFDTSASEHFHLLGDAMIHFMIHWF